MTAPLATTAQRPEDLPKLTARYCAVFLAFSIAALIPLFLSSPLPLGDYPNHLARLHILAHLDKSEFLQRYYTIEWAVIPNLASDILIPAVVRLGWFDVETASVLFMALSLLLTASGATILSRVLFGHWSYLSLSVFLLLYHRHFLWGFMNYVFSIGLMLWLLAAWIHAREKMHWSVRLLFCLPATALFIGHLFPLGVYGLCVMAYEWRPRPQLTPVRERLTHSVLAGLQFLPALGLLLFASPTTGRAGDILPGNAWNKLLGLLDIFNNYSMPLDVFTWLLVVGLLAYGIVRKSVQIHPAMRLPLLVLLVVYVALPNGLFSSGGADRRLTVAIWTLLAASLGGLSLSRRLQGTLFLVLASLFIVRMGVISWNWIQADAIYARFQAGMDRIERGARVAYIVGGPVFPWLRNPPLDHLGNLMIMHKDAFVNSLFAEPGVQVVKPKYSTDTAFYKFPSNVHRLSTAEEKKHLMQKLPLDRLDWVYFIHANDFSDLPASLILDWRDISVDAALYRIKH